MKFYNADTRQLKCVMEFANNGLPPLPIPEEAYQIRRPLTYPEVFLGFSLLSFLYFSKKCNWW